MSKQVLLILFLILVATPQLFSQTISLSGKALDSTNKEPLIRASVLLTNSKSDEKLFAFTNNSGEFEIKDVSKGNWQLKVSYVGYKPLLRDIRVIREINLDLGDLFVQPADVRTGEISVEANAILGMNKEDTTEINAAAYKTMKDASAEDLLKKMPSIEVANDGTVKAQGEQVKKLLVDGKPFFGDDVATTMKNLPAEVVDKVQVYDKASDQAAFSGFDDGNAQKTINIVTRRDKRNGEFGKFSLGYGTDDKYNASVNFNIFRDGTRLTLLGMSNNVNQQNFSMSDIMGMMGSSGGGGNSRRREMIGMMQRTGQAMRPPSGGFGGNDFMVGNSDGISTTHAFGLNYSDLFAEVLEVNASYFFNYSDIDNNMFLNRDYLLENDSLSKYKQNDLQNKINTNHRLNMKITWQLDSSNSFQLTPNLTMQQNEGLNNSFTEMLLANNNPLNQTKNTYNTDYTGINFSNELLYRLKFDKPGRTFSISLNNTYNDKAGDSYQKLYTDYFEEQGKIADSLWQKSTVPSDGYSYSVNASFTENISESSQLELNLKSSKNHNFANKNTKSWSEANQDYTLLDTLLSNEFDNTTTTNSAELGYNLNLGAFTMTAQLALQKTELDNMQNFPINDEFNYSYTDYLPALKMDYKFSKNSSWMMRYRNRTDVPSISQLQNVMDVSNPLQISSGNANLSQSNMHFFMNRYSHFSDDFSKMFFAFGMVQFRNDYIGNSTTVASKDTTINGFNLAKGGQYSTYKNFDGYFFTSLFFTYGFPVDVISSNLNLNLGSTYGRTPSEINNQINNSNAYGLNLMLTLSSNLSENLDFTMSSRANFSMTKNSIRESQNNQFNAYQNTVNLKWIFWEGIFFQTDLTNQIYTGLVSEGNSNYTILNFSVGTKLFDEKAELKFMIFDALKQNKSISTNVSDYYVEYANNSVLSQYLMLTFTYNLRSFGK